MNFAVDDFDRTVQALEERGFDTSGAAETLSGARSYRSPIPTATRSL